MIFCLCYKGVCDNKLLFTDVYAGEVGSIHDALLLRRSDLYQRMESTPALFPNNSHLIGDLAYPIRQHLMVGFKNNGRLTPAQHKFNRSLSSARSSIERAYALCLCTLSFDKPKKNTNKIIIITIIIAVCTVSTSEMLSCHFNIYAI